MNLKSTPLPQNPLVSVVVVSYNHEKYIEKCISSILEQICNFQFEIIVGDDFSKDGTVNICSEFEVKYPKIVKPLFHQENIGIAANFAICVKKAKGKYIAICAADDYWHNPYKLQLQVDYLENHLDYGMIYTDYNKLHSITHKIYKNYLQDSKIKIYEGSGLLITFFKGLVPALALTVLFRKDLFDKYIPADDYIKFRFPIEDWPTWLILSKYTKVGYLPISTGTYRYGHESISNPSQYEMVERRFAKEQVMYKYLCDMFPEDLDYSECGYLNYVNSILLNLAYKKVDYSSAKKYAQKLRKLEPKEIKIALAQNRITFYLFAILKIIRQYFKKNLFIHPFKFTESKG